MGDDKSNKSIFNCISLRKFRGRSSRNQTSSSASNRGEDEEAAISNPSELSMDNLEINNNDEDIEDSGGAVGGEVCRRVSEEDEEETGEEEKIYSNLMLPDSQIDYKSYLVPEMSKIIRCQYYWGKIDRYQAEELLEDKEEGSFLLRDSVQDDFVFSVSFRRYNRSLHARIEESHHKFSFDCHDPGVHSSASICDLLEQYKNPMNCMFFEPVLVNPVIRKHVFSLQDLARSVICDQVTSFSAINYLPLPKSLKSFIKEYHYKHKVRVRYLDNT